MESLSGYFGSPTSPAEIAQVFETNRIGVMLALKAACWQALTGNPDSEGLADLSATSVATSLWLGGRGPNADKEIEDGPDYVWICCKNAAKKIGGRHSKDWSRYHGNAVASDTPNASQEPARSQVEDAEARAFVHRYLRLLSQVEQSVLMNFARKLSVRDNAKRIGRSATKVHGVLAQHTIRVKRPADPQVGRDSIAS